MSRRAAKVVKTASHNLRAILLRLADGDADGGSWRVDGSTFRPDGCPDVTTEGLITIRTHGDRSTKPGPDSTGRATRMSLVDLTELGIEVADLVRPIPWSHDSKLIFDDTVRTIVKRPDGRYAFTVDSKLDEEDLGAEVARLLTERDLAAAKRYEAKP